METQTVYVTLEKVTCCNCGIVFGIDNETRGRLLDSGDYFWCPKGHRQWYGESNVKKLERQLQRERARHDQTQARLRDQKDRTARIERSRNAIKGQVTKIKNRVSKGVCPCCNRTFANLHRHMERQHPEWGGKNDKE